MKKEQILIFEDEFFHIEEIDRLVSRTYANIEIRPITSEEQRKKDSSNFVNKQAISHVYASNFIEAVYKAMLQEPSGILIDIDLRKYEFEQVKIGDIWFSNGIDIAQFFFEYNPNVPIAIYSGRLQDSEYQDNLSKLSTKIIQIEKSEISFEEVLREFLSSVEEFVQKRERLRPPKLEQFLTLPQVEQKNYQILTLLNIKTEKYFELVGSYAWAVFCRGSIKYLHGASFDETPMQIEHEISTTETIQKKDLLKLSQDRNALPVIFWNLKTPDALNLYLRHQAAPLLENLPVSYQFSFYYQAATKLADWYINQTIKQEDLIKNLSYLDDVAELEFQKQVLLFYQEEIEGVEDIPNIFGEIYLHLKNKIINIYKGEIAELEEEENTAWVLFENIFENKQAKSEPFKYDVLKDYGIEGDRAVFLYIFYTNQLGDKCRRIEPDFL